MTPVVKNHIPWNNPLFKVDLGKKSRVFYVECPSLRPCLSSENMEGSIIDWGACHVFKTSRLDCHGICHSVTKGRILFFQIKNNLNKQYIFPRNTFIGERVGLGCWKWRLWSVALKIVLLIGEILEYLQWRGWEGVMEVITMMGENRAQTAGEQACRLTGLESKLEGTWPFLHLSGSSYFPQFVKMFRKSAGQELIVCRIQVLAFQKDEFRSVRKEV